MGIFDNILGMATSSDLASVEAEFASILAEGERVELAYHVFRDLIVFTSKRMVLVNKLGVTGSRQEWRSIPYRSINSFSMETAGMLDLDAVLKIRVKGNEAPIDLSFRKNENVHEVYRALSNRVLD